MPGAEIVNAMLVTASAPVTASRLLLNVAVRLVVADHNTPSMRAVMVPCTGWLVPELDVAVPVEVLDEGLVGESLDPHATIAVAPTSASRPRSTTFAFRRRLVFTQNVPFSILPSPTESN